MTTPTSELRRLRALRPAIKDLAEKWEKASEECLARAGEQPATYDEVEDDALGAAYGEAAHAMRTLLKDSAEPAVNPYDGCFRDHEPDDDDLAFARETLGSEATEDEVYDLAETRAVIRCREEPCGAGADPYGRTAEDWARHAE